EGAVDGGRPADPAAAVRRSAGRRRGPDPGVLRGHVARTAQPARRGALADRDRRAAHVRADLSDDQGRTRRPDDGALARHLSARILHRTGWVRGRARRDPHDPDLRGHVPDHETRGGRVITGRVERTVNYTILSVF